MCVVSMVGDHFRDKWQPLPGPQPFTIPSFPPRYVPFPPGSDHTTPADPPTRAEFEKLRAEVEEMIRLLKRAKAYDERNNEPDCEVDEKMELLRKVAKLVGIDLDDVIAKKDASK